MVPQVATEVTLRRQRRLVEATGSGDKVSYTVLEFRFAFRLARVRQMDVSTG